MRTRARTDGTRSKYGAVKTTVDGIVFDSQREAARYHELKLLGLAGEIRNLEFQPRFPLHANGVQIGTYRADFAYEETTRYGGWFRVVEDVKGFKTPMYRWKAKHLKAEYGIQIREIR